MELIKQLRLRLTLMCTAVTSVILTAMAGASLWIAQTQLIEKGEAAFTGNINSILFHIRSQQVLDYTWTAQTEAAGGLILYVESGGQPFQYASTHQDKKRNSLIEMAVSTAKIDYNFDYQYPPESRIQADQVQFLIRDDSGEEYHAAAARIPLETDWASIIVIKSKEKEKQELLLQRWAFGGFTCLAVFLLFGFSWYFTARTLHPLAIAQKKQLEFISAASHELRSPLAVIQASITAMEGAAPEKAAQFSTAAISECSRMSRLIGDLLLLAGTDQGTWVMKREQVELDSLMLDTCEHFELIATKKKIRLTFSLPESPLPRCSCDPGRITQVLSILLDNAISYTPSNGKIRVWLESNQGTISCFVEDTGPGIPDSEKERVFQRFYRRDSSRTGEDHFGLGLCIAQEMIHLHHGKLEIKDTPGGGATIIFTLPVKTYGKGYNLR